ncbi:MAG TPA: hypothetical protein EYQ54_06040 [Myxococcales bacterium]|nr:hypothetical protein [Myxococcales bacterium]HIL80291.1 hypothetical protein [Myxococcales bacterium]
MSGIDGVGKTDPVSSGLVCDFCQNQVASVRRVALDGDYERLTTPHAVQYACSACFEAKDRARLGLAPTG